MKNEPAFPNPYRMGHLGMTLREYYIGQALAGCCAAMRP